MVHQHSIDFCTNILPGYTLVYDLPHDSIVGGIGIYVHEGCNFCGINHYKLYCNKVENIWLEVSKNRNKFIIRWRLLAS